MGDKSSRAAFNPWAAFPPRSFAPRVWEAFENYLAAEERWYDLWLKDVSAILPACLFPRLVKYATGGRVDLPRDIQGLAAWTFSGRKRDPRSWSDERYEKAGNQLRLWVDWRAREAGILRTIGSVPKHHNADLRGKALVAALRELDLTQRAVAIATGDRWVWDAPERMARMIVAAHQRVSPMEIQRGSRAVARFVRLYRQAGSRRMLRCLSTAALEVYRASSWRGQVCCWGKPGKAHPAVYAMNLALSLLRANAEGVEILLRDLGGLSALECLPQVSVCQSLEATAKPGGTPRRGRRVA